jgi:hypothetical protein
MISQDGQAEHRMARHQMANHRTEQFGIETLLQLSAENREFEQVCRARPDVTRKPTRKRAPPMA